MSDASVRLSWPPFVHELAELTKSISNAPPLYLVGGAVRDAYLRRAIGDIDVAVDGDAIAIARVVANAWGADIYIMDRERDVARVFVNSADSAATIDFAALRGPTLADDLRDRDFTMNAMAADLLGELSVLLDPLDGAADLRLRILRRCSPAAIADDPIRALRAVRQSVQYDLKIHPDTAVDVRNQATTLRQTSPERIRDEFFKLLGLGKAARGLRVMAHLGVLAQVLPLPTGEVDAALPVVERMAAILAAISSRRTDNTAAAFDLGTLVIQLDRFRAALQDRLEQTYGNGRTHAELLVLAALLHNLGEAKSRARDSASISRVAAAAKALRLTKAELRLLAAAVEHGGAIIEGEIWSPLDQHRFWHRMGASGIDAILLGAAVVLGRAGSALKQAGWLQLVERATILLDAYFNRHDTIVSPRLLLNGHDVLELLGDERGPRIGRMLTSLREAQVVGAVTSAAEARAFVMRRALECADKTGESA